MKPIPTSENVPTQLISISYRLEQQRIVHSDDAYWVAAGALVIRNLLDERDEVKAERNHAVAALSEQVDRMRVERDEARRDVCHAEADAYHTATAENIAKERGWDCFSKEVSDAT